MAGLRCRDGGLDNDLRGNGNRHQWIGRRDHRWVRKAIRYWRGEREEPRGGGKVMLRYLRVGLKNQQWSRGRGNPRGLEMVNWQRGNAGGRQGKPRSNFRLPYPARRRSRFRFAITYRRGPLSFFDLACWRGLPSSIASPSPLSHLWCLTGPPRLGPPSWQRIP